jgi:beta-phosphoglucomutase-like phosphatase (HAD superfamily)
VKMIIWDFDGTLLDTYPTMIKAFKNLLDDNHIQYDESEVEERLRESVSGATDLYLKNISDAEQKFNAYMGFTPVADYRPFAGVASILNSKKFIHTIITHRG